MMPALKLKGTIFGHNELSGAPIRQQANTLISLPGISTHFPKGWREMDNPRARIHNPLLLTFFWSPSPRSDFTSYITVLSGRLTEVSKFNGTLISAIIGNHN